MRHWDVLRKLDTVSTRVSMEVIVTYSSKLVYKLLTGLTNLLIRDIIHLLSIVTKYQQDIPVVADFNPTSKKKHNSTISHLPWGVNIKTSCKHPLFCLHAINQHLKLYTRNCINDAKNRFDPPIYFHRTLFLGGYFLLFTIKSRHQTNRSSRWLEFGKIFILASRDFLWMWSYCWWVARNPARKPANQLRDSSSLSTITYKVFFAPSKRWFSRVDFWGTPSTVKAPFNLPEVVGKIIENITRLPNTEAEEVSWLDPKRNTIQTPWKPQFRYDERTRNRAIWRYCTVPYKVVWGAGDSRIHTVGRGLKWEKCVVRQKSVNIKYCLESLVTCGDFMWFSHNIPINSILKHQNMWLTSWQSKGTPQSHPATK